VGHLGVYVFFVISGLLITWLMIREREATGTISFKDFYIRRCLRILPVFWALLVTVALLKFAGLLSVTSYEIFRVFTFTYNYPSPASSIAKDAWSLVHTWSLSLEEQFYLLWPITFFLLRRKLAARLALILALAGPVLPLTDYFLFPALRGSDGIEARIGLLMAGCAIAFVLDSPSWKQQIRMLPKWPIPARALLVLILLLGAPFGPSASASIGARIVRMASPSLEALLVALALPTLIAGKPGLAFRVLNLPLARHFGKLSFSIYIWQQLFLVPGSCNTFMPLLWRLLALYFVSLCSYYFLERPFLRLRSRFRNGVTV
jgi:peptidoglycan/LPS O-acetylase OafA/YrhL